MAPKKEPKKQPEQEYEVQTTVNYDDFSKGGENIVRANTHEEAGEEE